MNRSEKFVVVLCVLGTTLHQLALADEDVPKPRERAFPHNPAQARDPEDASCKGCHGVIPEPGAAPEQVALHMGPEGTCSMCHRGPTHAGADSHLGRIVPDPLRAGLSPQLALLEGGRIACFTCHEPHMDIDTSEHQATGERPLAAELRTLAEQREWAGLVERDAAWPPLRPAELPVMVSLPVENGALCRACHGSGPIRERANDQE